MGKSFISGREIISNYKISIAQLSKLVFENKLVPVKGAHNLMYNAVQVERYFKKLKQIEGLPKIISAKGVIDKYQLSRANFASLVQEGKLKPLPLKHEPNMHFEYLAVCEFFENNNK